VFPLAEAVNVPVESTGPETLSVPVVPCVQVEPEAEPVTPPAALVVTVPLLVTVMAPLIAIVPANERFAVDRIVCAALIVSVVVFVIDPVPSMLVAAPLSVTAPVPLSVPFTTRFPETPNVKVEVASTPDALIVTPVIVLLAFNVTVCPAAMMTLSVEAGTTPPTHVEVVLQLPV
jgi:hypothetical protein